jgi:sugar/nucleoside kinase (ribokinase family)
MTITIVGHVCIDTNVSERASYTSAGSPAMFMNTIYRQFPDTNVQIVAPYGPDFLEHRGDAALYPQQPNVQKTLVYENVSKNGMRHQKAYNRDEALPIPMDSALEHRLNGTDILFIAPLLPNVSIPYVQTLVSGANETTVKVLLPQGYYRDFDQDDNVSIRPFDDADSILPLVDIVIVSEQDHADMFVLATRWATQFGVIVIVTCGEKGAVAVTGNGQFDLPARAVTENDIVDSVGSGDIFSAGFAYRYHQTHDLHEAGRFANELARQCLFYTPDNIRIDYQALVRE